MKLQWQNMTAFARRVLWNLGACSVYDFYAEQSKRHQTEAQLALTRRKLFDTQRLCKDLEEHYFEAITPRFPVFSAMVPPDAIVRQPEADPYTRLTLREQRLHVIVDGAHPSFILHDRDYMKAELSFRLRATYAQLIEHRIDEIIKTVLKENA